MGSVPRHALVLLLSCLPLVGTGLAAAPAASADTGFDYVALGDSYAAGVGATPDGVSGACGRSPESYPALYAGGRTLTSVACSGATSTDVLRRQIGSVTADTDLVTITVGGNDTGFGPVLTTCTVAVSDESCARAVRAGERIARYVLPVGLGAVYGAVRLHAPHARVVVLGYPRLFDGTACAGAPSPARQQLLNAGADVLSASIRGTATRLGVEFVDVRAAFAGHGVCSGDPWINGPAAAGAYHPTAVGYARGYLPALRQAAA
ncbi:MAG: SGNH/GDSL hydrolase family protein [Pseudonocardia sp.]|nr:SGNH/GDSL hydrolase family protein [Pseudonocardia sp.]